MQKVRASHQLALALMKLNVDVFGLIHGKAGLVRYPDGRAITFLGSVNESASAWKLNYELLWEDDSPEAVAWVAEVFESLWHDSKAVDLACCPLKGPMNSFPKITHSFQKALRN